MLAMQFRAHDIRIRTKVHPAACRAIRNAWQFCAVLGHGGAHFAASIAEAPRRRDRAALGHWRPWRRVREVRGLLFFDILVAQGRPARRVSVPSVNSSMQQPRLRSRGCLVPMKRIRFYSRIAPGYPTLALAVMSGTVMVGCSTKTGGPHQNASGGIQVLGGVAPPPRDAGVVAADAATAEGIKRDPG